LSKAYTHAGKRFLLATFVGNYKFMQFANKLPTKMSVRHENKRNYIKIKPLLDKGFEIIGNKKKQELLSDTKLRKYIIQFILIRHRPSDLSKVVKAGTDVKRDQVAGEVVVQAVLYIYQRAHHFL